MNLTRREFTTLAVAAAAGSALTPIALAAFEAPQSKRAKRGAFFDWRSVGDRARAGFGGGGNALVVASKNEAVLIDCKNFGFGPTLRNEAHEQFGALTAVINTHHHGDHSGGNHAFTDDLPLYAQQNAKERIVQNASRTLGRVRAAGDTALERYRSQLPGASKTPGGAKRAASDLVTLFKSINTLDAKQFAPTDTFDTTKELAVGGLTLQLHHIGPGHTDNDAFVFIPELNVLHTGDLLFYELHPFIDMGAGASSEGWMKNCDAMLELCDAATTVIPGHGEITDRSGIAGQKEYFQMVRNAMASAHKEGKSRDEAIKIELPALADYGFEQIKERTFGSVYDEMAKN